MSRRDRAPRLDALLLRAWARELDGRRGAQVQKIFEPEPGTFVLHLHPSPEGAPLLIRLQGAGFLGWGEPGVPNPAEPPAFCMLLRKHLEGSRLSGAVQPALDRWVRIGFDLREEDGAIGSRALVVELLGTRSNLHLLDAAGRILGSWRRLPRDRDRFGPERVHAPPPLPEGQLDPGDLDTEGLRAAFAGATTAKAVARRLSGIGPDLATLLLACPDPTAALQGLLTAAGPAGPFRVVSRGERALLLVGGPDPLPEGYQVEVHPDLATLTRAALQGEAAEDRRERAARECQKAIEKMAARLDGQLEKNAQGQRECARADELQSLGELLKVNLGRLARGARSVTLTDYSSGTPREVTVPLDHRRSPPQNMDHYFQRARRLRLKLPMLERKARHLERDRQELDELRGRLEHPDCDPAALKEELRALGVLGGEARPTRRAEKKGKKSRKDRRELRTFVSSDGLRILVGRSNEENDYLVRRAGSRGDPWLHAEGGPGAHVLVKLAGGTHQAPQATLVEAAQLAAHFSKQRYAKKASVMVSEIGVVKKAPNAPPGQVLVPRFQTLVVETDPQVVRRLAPLGAKP